MSEGEGEGSVASRIISSPPLYKRRHFAEAAKIKISEKDFLEKKRLSPFLIFAGIDLEMQNPGETPHPSS